MSSPRLNRLPHQKADHRPTSPLAEENEAIVSNSPTTRFPQWELGRGTEPRKRLWSIGMTGSQTQESMARPQSMWEQKHDDHGRRGMLIRVYVTSNATEARVVKVGDDSFEVRVDERAVNGRANKRLLEILSRHFVVSKSRIFISKGMKSRDKIVQVNLES